MQGPGRRQRWQWAPASTQASRGHHPTAFSLLTCACGEAPAPPAAGTSTPGARGCAGRAPRASCSCGAMPACEATPQRPNSHPKHVHFRPVGLGKTGSAQQRAQCTVCSGGRGAGRQGRRPGGSTAAQNTNIPTHLITPARSPPDTRSITRNTSPESANDALYCRWAGCIAIAEVVYYAAEGQTVSARSAPLAWQLRASLAMPAVCRSKHGISSHC